MQTFFSSRFSQNTKPLELWILLWVLCWHSSLVLACSKDSDCENTVCEFGQCACVLGTFGKDCSGKAAESLPDSLTAVQIILSIIFIPAFAFGVYGLYLSVTHKRLQAVSPLSNIRLHIFLAYQLTVIVNFLSTCLDPFMTHGIIKSRLFLFLMMNATYPFSIFGFGCILFHWIDVIHLATVTLNREYMLQKISKTYRSKDVTLEDILKQVKFMSNLKIPFLFLMGLVFVLIILLSCTQAYSEYPRISERLVYLISTISFIVLCLGFLYYGRKMVKIMPFELTKRVKKLTKRLQILCMAVVFLIVVLAIIFFVVGKDRNAQSAIAALFLVGFLKFTLGIIAISCLFERTNRFPFIVFSFSTESKRSSTKSGSGSNRSSSDELPDLRRTSLDIFDQEKQDNKEYEEVSDNDYKDNGLIQVVTKNTSTGSHAPLVSASSGESTQTTYSNPPENPNSNTTQHEEDSNPRMLIKSYSSDAHLTKLPPPPTSPTRKRKFGGQKSVSMYTAPEQKPTQQ